jgi:DNA-binding MarR family transcriptional regulator
MSAPEQRCGIAATSPDRKAGPSEEDSLHRFLRCGHILGALLRELLDQSYLGGRCPVPLTRTQFCVLKLITVNADLQVGKVARYLGVSPAAISRCVDKLAAMDLVHREPSSQDRRAILLSASAAGQRLVEGYETLKESWVAPVLAGVDTAEFDRVCEVLELLCVDLLQRTSHSPGQCMRCAGYFSPDCLLGIAQGECALRSEGGMPMA